MPLDITAKRSRGSDQTPKATKRIVPLDRSVPAALARGGRARPFAIRCMRSRSASPNFRRSCAITPIASCGAGRARYRGMAILGMHEGQNLVVMADGTSGSRTYIPPTCALSVLSRRQPRGGGRTGERLICIEPRCRGELRRAARCTTSWAEPLPTGRSSSACCTRYEDDLVLTRDMCGLFAHRTCGAVTLRAELVEVARCRWTICSGEPRGTAGARPQRAARSVVQGSYGSHLRPRSPRKTFSACLNRRSFFAAEPPSSPKHYN